MSRDGHFCCYQHRGGYLAQTFGDRKPVCGALEADAAQLYTDVYTSVGVFLGLLCITIGRRFLEVDLTWVDPVIAIAVAILILVTASSWGNPSWVV